jgi:hypothetical protein
MGVWIKCGRRKRNNTRKQYLSKESLFLRSAKNMSLCKTWGTAPVIPNFDIRWHEWSSKPFCCFNPGELGSLTHWIESSLEVSAGLKSAEKWLLGTARNPTGFLGHPIHIIVTSSTTLPFPISRINLNK